jgi:cyd operon protein YbgT
MWYFAWALGVSLAASFAILNALWLELDAQAGAPDQRPEADRGR